MQLINDNNRTGGNMDPATLQKQIAELAAKLEKFEKPQTVNNSGVVKTVPGDQAAAAKATG